MMLLGGCGGTGSSDFFNTNSAISEFLTVAAIDAISLDDDGSEPVNDGNWKRYSAETTWNWQLRGLVNLDYDANVYVVDMFELTRTDTVERLHALGRDVICYYSAGTYEHWRPDASLYSDVAKGNSHVGFGDEKWLDVRDPAVVKLMINRMNIANALGCDGVELDNVDAFVNNSGFNVTLDDQKSYFRILANEAHRRNLTVALKNSVEMIEDLADYFDVLINEECFQYDECEGYLPVVESGKPVFNAEYTTIHVNDLESRQALCVRSRGFGFQTLILPLALDGSFRFDCR